MPSKNDSSSLKKSKRQQKLLGSRRNAGSTKKTVGMTRPAFRRIARAAGIKRVPDVMYSEGERIMDQFYRLALEGAITFAAMNNRKTIQTSDIKNSLAIRGRTVYGSIRVPRRSKKEKKSATEE